MPTKRTKEAPLRVLQWNCRSLSRRKAELLKRIEDYKFDILLLQETRTDEIDLSGYHKIANPAIKRAVPAGRRNNDGEKEVKAQVNVFISRKLAFIVINTDNWCTDYQEVVAVRVALQTTQRRLTIASAYACPSKPYDHSWLNYLKDQYPDDYLIMGGDLNARIEDWANLQQNRRTKELMEAIEAGGLELINDVTRPTRHSLTSCQLDTIIDVTLATPTTARKITWDMTQDAWGSDHFPIIMDVAIGGNNLKQKKANENNNLGQI